MIGNIKTALYEQIAQYDYRELAKFVPTKDDQQYRAVSPYLASGLDAKAKAIYDKFVLRMLYNPQTGQLQAGGQTQPDPPLSLEQIKNKARDERRANMTHEERWLDDILGVQKGNKKSDPKDWYQQRPTSQEAGIVPPVRSKAELAEWWWELSAQEKEKALGLMSSEERGLLRELYMERPR